MDVPQVFLRLFLLRILGHFKSEHLDLDLSGSSSESPYSGEVGDDSEIVNL